jgi:hypothetical protein
MRLSRARKKASGVMPGAAEPEPVKLPEMRLDRSMSARRPMNLFSINGAAELLEMDRATIARSLRRTPPDADEGGKRRWHLATIVRALLARTKRPPATNGGGYGGFADLDTDLTDDLAALPLFADFNAAFAKMETEPNLAKRRSMAISFAPKMIKLCMRAYRAHCHAADCFIDPGTRADCMWHHLLEGFETSCDWTYDEVVKNFRLYEDEA